MLQFDIKGYVAALDPEDPFEIDSGNRPHLYRHAPYGEDDVYDVWWSDPLFYPPTATKGAAVCLMVGEVTSVVLMVPLTHSKYSGPTKTRPMGIYEASMTLTNRFRDDTRL
jgi:hypothetical protein